MAESNVIIIEKVFLPSIHELSKVISVGFYKLSNKFTRLEIIFNVFLLPSFPSLYDRFKEEKKDNRWP